MCGIVGIAHRDRERPVGAECIRKMCDAIRHRGPDDEGVWVNGHVGMGMRRLSIIDLAGGHQPIFNEDGSSCIVFNGEIYNYRDLRNGLLQRNHRFQTNSDTETILHLYEERGQDCVRDLRGMFAFAIWDGRAERLLLARDRFGIKPLYVATGPWGIAFASELKALLAAGLSERQLDWEALDAYFQLGYIPAPATPFRDVRKLEPGCTLSWTAGAGSSIQPYWDLPSHHASAPANVADRVLAWLDESVSAHLVSDVPVAAFLSGGLDSSAVVASMAALEASPHAFTARYTGSGSREADESALARELAQRCGARLTIIDVEPELQDNFERIVWSLDEPHADDSAIPTWLLSQHVGREYKVALTGIGGDELFAGYRRHIGLLLGQQYARLPRPLRRAASAGANMLHEPDGAGLGIDRLKRFLRPGGAADPASMLLSFVTRANEAVRDAVFAPDLRRGISGAWARKRFEDLYAAGGDRRGLAAGLYLDYKTFLPDDILALSDRLAMAHSLEIRVPFVDHALVEHVFPLGSRVKIGWGERKRLLKQALRSRLPAAHFHAPKRGFVGPTSAWLRAELRERLEDELSEQRLGRLGYFRASAVRQFQDEHFARRQNREGLLWALLCFSTWHRLYVETPSPAYRRS